VDPVTSPAPAAVDLIGLTRSLVDIDSTTGLEKDAGVWLSRYLREMGFSVTEQHVDDSRFNVFATASDRVASTVVLSTHFDCVPPFFPSRLEDSRIVGRGACDAKGILAAQVAAVDRLRREKELRVGLLFDAREASSERTCRAFVVPGAR
jgi:acetylornithine deacetylase